MIVGIVTEIVGNVAVAIVAVDICGDYDLDMNFHECITNHELNSSGN